MYILINAEGSKHSKPVAIKISIENQGPFSCQ